MRKLALVNGLPKMVDEAAAVSIYDETYVVPSTITAGAAITLPLSGTYTNEDLEVRLNGVRMDSGEDYSYVGSPPRTQITFAFDLVGSPNADRLNFRVDEAAAAIASIYDQTFTVISDTTTGVPITLPLSKTYMNEELEVRLNGVRMDSGIDYTYVGSAPRTQIAFTFDLVGGTNPDKVNFRIDRPEI